MNEQHTAANVKRVAQLESALREMLVESLRRGFFGEMSVQVTIQDGTIQHIRRRVEQIER